MIGTIRKHSKSLWWIIIVVIIFAFVIWGSKTGDGPGGGSGNLGTMNGHAITPTMYENSRREVLLYHLFATGSFPGTGRSIPGFNIERETYNRILVILKAEEMGIQISDELAGKAAAERLRMVGGGKPVSYADFETQVLARERLNVNDF